MKYCSDCKNLNLKKEKPPGWDKYKKVKKNLLPCTPICDKYEYDWSCGERKRQEVFKKALKDIHVDRKPMRTSELFVFTLFALILWLIAYFHNKRS